MLDTSKPWEFYCSPEHFLALRDRDDFAVMVALARAISQVRWARHTLDGLLDGDDSPYSRRQQTGALVNMAAAMFEAVKLARHHVGKFFHSHPAFPELAKVWKSGEYNLVADGGLTQLRNQYVAHSDPRGAKAQMAELEFEDRCIFSMGTGPQAKDEHHTLADALAMLSLFGPEREGESVDERATRVLAALGTAAGDFVSRADHLLAELLLNFGFEARNI